MNPLDWIGDSLRYWPEPPNIPELDSVHELAEARSRLAQIIQVATELRRQIDRELALQLDGKALRYGNDIMRPKTRGTPRVIDEDGFWRAVDKGLQDSEDSVALLAALFPSHSIRLGALPKLAMILGVNAETLRETFIDYDPPTSPLDVMPIAKAPKFLQRLNDGETG